MSSNEIYSVRRYNLTGNETNDNIYVNAVLKLAEACNGQPYLAHKFGKGLYCIEVGGIFWNTKYAVEFQENWDKYDEKFKPKTAKKTRKKAVAA